MTRVGAEADDPRSRQHARVAGVIFALVFTGIGALLGELLHLRGVMRLGFAMATGVASGWFVHWMALGVTSGGSRGITAFIFPSGASVPYEATFSAHDALEASGDVAGAIAAYDATLVEEPGNRRAIRQAAELHARAGTAERAAQLFVALRASGASREDELYATQRLADLYLGALGDDGRALVELRRLVERFPGTREATGAREALSRIKRMHHVPRGGEG